MIFLIIMLLSSVTCCASHHDEKSMIEDAKKKLLSRLIVGNVISSSQALTAWVSLQDIYNTEPTDRQLHDVCKKISTLRLPGYEVSKIILPSCKNQVRKQTVSYYKRSQNKNASDRNAALAQDLDLDLQVSDVPQKKEGVISLSATSQSLISQAINTQMSQKEVEKPQCEKQANSGSDGSGELLSPIRVSRHKENFKVQLKNRCFDSDSDDDSDDEF